MTDERRYTASEIEEIFNAAAADRRSPQDASPGEGLSLADLQAIGKEVGMSPRSIAEAAAHLDRRPPTPDRITLAGAPVGVRMAVALPDAPNEREWGMLVAELRRTFAAEGRVSTAGELREWRNGRLYATVEPTEHGYQLRMGTRKSQVPGNLIASAILFFLALGTFQDGGIAGGLLFSGIGAIFLAPLFRLPKWAKLREAQMAHVGDWTRRLIGRRGEAQDAAADPEGDLTL